MGDGTRSGAAEVAPVPLDEAPVVVLMGPAGSGKSTIGRLLAARLGVSFVDADDLHAPDAVARMRGGLPLDDAARGPWLDRVRAAARAHRGTGVVVACSALRAAHRARLARDGGVQFVALVVPDDVLAARLRHRRGHFAGPELLASQLATLELDAGVVQVDGARPPERIVDALAAALRPGGYQS